LQSNGVGLLCLSFAGDPYFVEYLEPYTSYELTIRAMSEVGDGEPLKYIVTTPDVCECERCYTAILKLFLINL